MTFLRNIWHSCAVYQYFAGMERIDRATALIVLALLLAWAIAFAAIVRAREPAVDTQLTAPPFTMDFAGVPNRYNFGFTVAGEWADARRVFATLSPSDVPPDADVRPRCLTGIAADLCLPTLSVPG